MGEFYDLLIDDSGLAAFINCRVLGDRLSAGVSYFEPGCPREIRVRDPEAKIYKHVCIVELPDSVIGKSTPVLTSSPIDDKANFRCQVL